MTKKILSAVLALLMLASMMLLGVSCTKDDNKDDGKMEPISLDAIKVGFIFLHDETSTYDKNFIDAAKAAQKALGLKDSQVIMKTGVPEGSDCYEQAADLVDQGCNVIFADSFGHETWILKAAREYKNVQFCHATGTLAHTEKQANFHNAFASIYEGRYLAGIAAGMKLNEMIAEGKFTAEEAKMGYVGAWPYAEVISGYTSFYLGAKSVCPTVTMDVDFTNSWFDVDAEREMAKAMISRGCKLISQHADSMGAPSACESAGVPNVSYNGSTQAQCPNTYIVSSKINWQPYFEYMINCVVEGKAIVDDWTGTLATGSVELTQINESVAAKGTVAAVAEAEAALKAGTLKVFDTNTFTVGGEKLTSYKADVDTDSKYTPDTEAIADGYFHESEKRSAPYFDVSIDGITRLDRNKD